MKRKISLILVLAMILSVMLPFAALAEGEITSTKELFNRLVEKKNELKPIGAKRAANIVESLYENRDDIKNSIKKSLGEDEKELLKGKDITDENIGALLKTVKEYIPNEDDIKKNEEGQYENFLVKLIFDEEPTYEEYENDIKKMVEDIYDDIPKPLKDDLERYATEKDEKIAFFLEFADAFIDEKVGTGTYDATEEKWTKIELEVTENHITKANEILETPKGEQTKIVLGTTHKKILNALTEELNTRLNNKELLQDAGEVLKRTDLIKVNTINEPSDDEPSTGGGGGTTAPSTGGGGSTTPAKPETPPAEIIDTTESIKAVLGEDDIKVTKKDGVATVEVEEDKVLATVEAMAKKAEGRDAVLIVEAKDVEDMNAVVSLPGSVALELEDKKVNVEIVTKEIEYNVPYNAINTENVDKNSRIELRSKEVTNDLTNEIGEVKSAVDLSMVLIKDKKETVITNFNAPIEVRINVKGKGNYEKLAAYYLNEEDNTLEFVSGHIEDDKLIMKLDHFSKYVLIESTKTFPDIADHWAKENIESMVAKNIINGYEDGTFRPEEKITRAEFVKMIVNALNAELVEYDNEFSDVKASDWHADYIATANELGLINGYTDGTFRPNATIKRAEMASILAKVVDDEEVYEEDIEALKTKFNDYKDIPEWALESVAKVVKVGLMNGTGKGFSPNNDTTRAQGATTVYRVYMK